MSADGGVNFVGEADKGQKEPQGRAGKEYSMYDFKAGAQLMYYSLELREMIVHST